MSNGREKGQTYDSSGLGRNCLLVDVTLSIPSDFASSAECLELVPTFVSPTRSRKVGCRNEERTIPHQRIGMP